MDQHTQQIIFSIERPSSKLLMLYFLRSLSALFGFPFVFVPLLFKYITLRYQFDEEGVSASWGLIFKRQVHLTYGRIQDIHLNRSLIERWLNLGTVDIQTASGSASAELSVVGLEEYEQIRDFLYTKMRGVKEGHSSDAGEETAEVNETLEILHAIRDEMKAIRESLNAGDNPNV